MQNLCLCGQEVQFKLHILSKYAYTPTTLLPGGIDETLSFDKIGWRAILFEKSLQHALTPRYHRRVLTSLSRLIA